MKKRKEKRKHRGKFHDIGFGKDLLDITSKAYRQQRKNKLDYIKILNLWIKGQTSCVKWQTMEWEKTFANHVTGKDEYPQYVKNS